MRDVLIATVFLLLVSSHVVADGKYFPPLALADDKPNMPSQRALLVWRDARETLVVESSVSSHSPVLAWVMPLPAAPETVEEISPGFFETLENATSPEVIDGSKLDWSPFPVFSAVFLVIVATATSFICWFSRKRLLHLLIVVVCLLFYGFFIPALGSAGGNGTPLAVTVLRQTEVGSYDVTVLRSSSADALFNWLLDNGFSPPGERETTVIEDYVEGDWCFVAARLKVVEGQISRPHPILFSFPSDKPVYPMRLTGLGSERLFLEIFVATSGGAVHPKLEKTFCGEFSLETIDPDSWIEEFDGPMPTFLQARVGRRRRIAHTDAVAVLGGKTMLTRMQGELAPEEMIEDFVFSIESDGHFAREVYSERGKVSVRAERTFWILLLVAVVSPPIGYLLSGRRRLRAAVITLAVGVCLSFPAAHLSCASIKAVTPRYVDRSSVRNTRIAVRRILEGSAFLPDNEPAEGIWKSVTETCMAERSSLRDSLLINPVTGESRQLRQFPGDANVEDIDGKRYLTFYDTYCVPYRVRIPRSSEELPPAWLYPRE